MEEEVSTFWHWLVAAVITPVAVAISAFFGGWTAAMTTLVTVMVLDIVSGLARAFVQKQVSSNVSWNGMVKKSLVGVGRAEKEQVAFMVAQILGVKKPDWALDASDALAVAICHLNERRMRKLTGAKS